ncbi:MotA/TolQ/ExbB proton channel family protein [Kaustia mangrovi]|uniref:MotA/TolQ/ExbB proton channel family protein n=1 Tax=Kaustia mangrovi TaxID=2593653 RepID=A0A7S8C1V0_9HYPH|nr:MotA/TolQ/ExbB proton channel family protein [Kaustia mangrovi]QPC41840.1 MotA/TolQ/ExbB proton channel family protein [Kaustia mangrovi]
MEETLSDAAIGPVQAAQPASWWDSLASQAGGFLEMGGPVVVFLLFLSVLALAVLVLKLKDLLPLTEARNRTVAEATRVWMAGRPGEAATMLKTGKGPVAHVVRETMNGALEQRADALVREDAERLGQEVMTELRRYLRVLEAVAQVAPLIGLFGTILGMIEAFRVLQEAGAQVDPAALAGGIWVALLTTAVGLAIAIPAVFALHWCESRIARTQTAIETLTTRVLTHPPFARPAAGNGHDEQPAHYIRPVTETARAY